MKRRHFKKLYILFFVVLVTCCVCPSAFSAEPTITTDSDNQNFYELHSVVMEVNQAKHYLIVGEQRIDLIDMKRGTRRFKTMIRNSQGNAIPLRSLNNGRMVFIRGFAQPDGRIMAREIYRLPQSIQTRRALQKFPFYGKIPTWEPVK